MGFRDWWRRTLDPNTESEPPSTPTPETGPAVSRVAQCQDRDKVCLRGTITALIPPQDAAPELVAEMSDGSGTVHLVWMGRRCIPGIEVGATLAVVGRISNQEGQRVMFNPRYELGAQP